MCQYSVQILCHKLDGLAMNFVLFMKNLCIAHGLILYISTQTHAHIHVFNYMQCLSLILYCLLQRQAPSSVILNLKI